MTKDSLTGEILLLTSAVHDLCFTLDNLLDATIRPVGPAMPMPEKAMPCTVPLKSNFQDIKDRMGEARTKVNNYIMSVRTLHDELGASDD